MKKKNKKENTTSGTTEYVTTIFPTTPENTSCNATCTFHNFSFKKVWNIKDTILDILISGASLFFVDMLYQEVMYNFNLKSYAFIEYVLLGYLTYRAIKFLRE